MTLALCIFFFAYLIRVSFFSLIGYLFKRYALDGLKEQMREQEKQKEVLRQACLALERERELISQAAHEQELVVARLHEHVRHWGERFSVIVAQREAEKQKLMHELARKTALQQEHLSADVIAHLYNNTNFFQFFLGQACQ